MRSLVFTTVPGTMYSELSGASEQKSSQCALHVGRPGYWKRRLPAQVERSLAPPDSRGRLSPREQRGFGAFSARDSGFELPGLASGLHYAAPFDFAQGRLCGAGLWEMRSVSCPIPSYDVGRCGKNTRSFDCAMILRGRKITLHSGDDRLKSRGGLGMGVRGSLDCARDFGSGLARPLSASTSTRKKTRASG